MPAGLASRIDSGLDGVRAKRRLAAGLSLLVLLLPPQAWAARSRVELLPPTFVDEPSLADGSIRDFMLGGLHCLSSLDGSNASAVEQIRARADHGASFAHIETDLAPAVNGRHDLVTVYTTLNAHGSEVVHQAHGWVDQATCTASLAALG